MVISDNQHNVIECWLDYFGVYKDSYLYFLFCDIELSFSFHSTIYRFNKVYDSLYNLCLAEDSIHPEKYIVSDYPPMNAFPAQHPNRVLQFDTPKDEL